MANQENGLSLIDNSNALEVQRMEEFGVDASTAREIQKIQGSIIVAQKFRRNEDEIYQSLMTTCKRTSFAERGEYKYPRGKVKDEATGRWVDNIISGPSVYLSRAAIRLWGNVEIGTVIIRDTDDERHIRSEVWDMQSNVRRYAEASFRKLVQRKVPSDPSNFKSEKVTQWVRPDERDLRELTNKHAAICERNAAIQLLPDDLIQDARIACRKALMAESTQDPAEARRKVIMAFAELNVTVTELEKYLGHPLAQCSPAELVDLRQVFAAIKEGNATWNDLINAKEDEDAGTVSEDQAVEFYTAWKGAGWTQQDVAAWLKSEFKISDGRKLPSDGFAKAMAWARSKQVAKAGEVISPNKDAAPASDKPSAEAAINSMFPESSVDDPSVIKAIQQLFDILGTPAKMQKSLLKDHEGRISELKAKLEADLPE